jgi:2'-5' RNA ligase
MRLFVATHFPAEILRDLNDRVAALKPKLPPASWVRPESQHLTFAFLGEQSDDAFTADLSGVPRFEALLHGCGFFPNRRNARVGWIGVEPEERFIEVAEHVRAALEAARVDFDRKDFRPHLTVMRLRNRWPPLSIQTFENGLRDYRSAPFAVSSVTLYSSTLHPTGAVHTPVRHFALA